MSTSLENGHKPQQILPQEHSEPATSSQELNITSPTAQRLADHVFEIFKGADDRTLHEIISHCNNLMSFRQDVRIPLKMPCLVSLQ